MVLIILVFTAIAAVFDARTKRIPNELLVVGLAVWIFAAIKGHVDSMMLNVISGLLVTALLLVVRNLKPPKKLLGAGDIKLIFLIVLFCGLDEALSILLISFIAALFEGAYLLCFHQINKNYRMALAPALFVGCLTHWLIGGM